MSIRDFVRRPVCTLSPDATCCEAARQMRDENIGAVVVVEGSRPLGVVTDRDLVTRVMAEEGDASKLQLRDVMSEEPIFVSEDHGLDQVVTAMRDLAIRRVPVVNAAGDLTGIVAMDDLLILLADQLGDLASAIREEVR